MMLIFEALPRLIRHPPLTPIARDSFIKLQRKRSLRLPCVTKLKVGNDKKRQPMCPEIVTLEVRGDELIVYVLKSRRQHPLGTHRVR